MRAVVLALLVFTAPLAGFAASSRTCARLLGDATQSLTAYLGQLLDERVIDESALERVRSSLQSGDLDQERLVEDIIPRETALESSAAAIQREGFERMLEGAVIDRTELGAWIESRIKDSSHRRESRNEANEKTKYLFKRIAFNSVKPGKFMMGADPDRDSDSKNPREVTLTKRFELMSHLLTEWQWVKVMHEEPWFDDESDEGDPRISVRINGKGFSIQPDHPIYGTYKDLTRIIPRLNELSKKEDPVLYEIIPDYQRGDQFRLPTEAEWEYVATNRGRNLGKYFFGNKVAQLKKYAWYAKNSKFVPQPVGELLPLVVDGKEFFDILGNVSEWVSDFWSARPRGGKDPQGPKSGRERVLRGGSGFDGDDWEQSTFWRDQAVGDQEAGLRLVRVRAFKDGG